MKLKTLLSSIIFLIIFSFNLSGQCGRNFKMVLSTFTNPYGNIYYFDNPSQLYPFSVCKDNLPVKFKIDSVQNATYQLYKNGVKIQESKNTNFIVFESGNYQTKILYNNGCESWTCQWQVNVTEGIPAVIFENGLLIKDRKINICQSTSVRLNVVTDDINNFYPYVYQWLKDGKYIPSTNQNFFETQETGKYSVLVSQEKCYTTASAIEIFKISSNDTLKSPVEISALGMKNNEISLCSDLKEEMTINFFGINNPSNGIFWFRDGKLIQTTKQNEFARLLIDKGSKGSYFATWKDFRGCNQKTQIVKVSEKEKETSLAYIYNTDIKQCDKKEYLLRNYSISRDKFQKIDWYSGEKLVQTGNNFDYTVKETGNYYVKVTTQDGCVGRSNEILIDFSQKNYEVKLLPINGTASPIAQPSIVTLCNGGGVQVNSFRLNYNPTKSAQYQWYKDGKTIITADKLFTNQTGKYHLKIEDNGCTYKSDTVEVKVLASTFKPMTISDLCEDGQIKMKVSPKPTGAFTWYTSYNNSTTYYPAGYENKEVIPTYPNYNYYTLGVDENLCVLKSNTVRAVGLIVNQVSLNPTTISINKNLLCWGDSVKISVSNSEAFDSFQWFGPLKFKATGAEIKIKRMETNTSGYYEIVGKTKSGCLLRQERYVYFNKPLGIQPYHVNCDDVSAIRVRTYDSDSTSSNNAYGEYFFSIFGPNQAYSSSIGNNPSFNLKTMNANVNGKFTISNLASNFNNYNNTCFAKADITIDLAKKSCQGIKLVPLNKEIRVCPQTTYDIPFTTADMPVGTVYEVYIYSPNYSYYNYRVGSGTKSPIKITIPNDNAAKSGLGYYIRSADGKFQSESSDGRTFVVIDGQIGFNVGNDAPQGQICSGKVNFITEQVSVPINYQWVVDNVDVPNATKPTFTLEKTGVVFLKYSLANGCTYSSGSTYITIGSIRQPGISTNSLISCKSDEIPINGYSNYENYPDYANKLTYQWYKDDKLIEGAKTKNFFPKETGYYSLKTSVDGCESVSSNKLKITKDNNFLVNIYSYGYNSEQSVFCNKQNVNLYTNDYQNSTVVYQWQKDGIDIVNANALNYQAQNNGVYNLKITKGTSCYGFSNELKINFQDKVKIKLLAEDAVSCEGKKGNINLDYRTWNPYSFDFNTAKSFATIYNVWNKDGKPFSAAANVLTSISTYEKGKFNTVNKVYRNDSLLCTIESDTVEIKNTQSIVQSPSQKIYNCADSLVLNNAIYVPSEYGSYSFEWKKDNQSIQKTNFVSSIVAKSSGTYTAQATLKDGCTISQSTEVVLGQIKPILSATKNVCDGNVVYMFADNTNIDGTGATPTGFLLQKDGKDFVPESVSNYNRTLYFQVYESGKYTIKVGSGKCTGTSEPIDVNIIKLSEKLSPNTDTTSYCGQNLVELVSDNPVTHQYKWELNEKPLSAFTQNLKTKTDGRYRVLIRKEGCARYSNTVVVNTDIVPNKLNVADSSVCGIQTIDLKAPAGTGTNYVWEKDGKVIPDSPYGLFQAKESGTYRALLSKARCKIYTTEAKIKMKPLPDAIVTPEVTGIVYQPGIVKLNASVGTGYQYQWSKDSKIIDGAKSAVYDAKEGGRYQVAVTLDGCVKQSGIIEVRIEIPLATENYIDPSGVSVYPNPSNGSFKIELPNDLKNAQIQLFDNLGVEHNLTQDEEGKYWAKNLPEGKYLLRISKKEKSVGKHLMVEK